MRRLNDRDFTFPGCFGERTLGVVDTAYEGLQADYATCAQGRGKVANNRIVAACTRLIDNAAQKNELVGYFHALRAIASTDRGRNCRDARMALQLLKDPQLAGHVRTLQKANC